MAHKAVRVTAPQFPLVPHSPSCEGLLLTAHLRHPLSSRDLDGCLCLSVMRFPPFSTWLAPPHPSGLSAASSD